MVISTPAGKFNFFNSSTVLAVGSKKRTFVARDRLLWPQGQNMYIFNSKGLVHSSNRNSVPLSRFTSSILCVKCASSCTDCISSIQFFASCFCGSSAWCIGLFLARPLLFVPCTPTSLAIGHPFSSKQPWLARNLGKRMSTSWAWKKTRRWKLGRIKWSGKVRSYLLRR